MRLVPQLRNPLLSAITATAVCTVVALLDVTGAAAQSPQEKRVDVLKDEVAHKHRCTTNDVGFIELPDGRKFAIAVFINGSRAPMELREQTIAQIARAAYDYLLFQRLHGPRSRAFVKRTPNESPR
jgi:hypothetical protein